MDEIDKNHYFFSYSSFSISLYLPWKTSCQWYLNPISNMKTVWISFTCRISKFYLFICVVFFEFEKPYPIRWSMWWYINQLSFFVFRVFLLYKCILCRQSTEEPDNRNTRTMPEYMPRNSRLLILHIHHRYILWSCKKKEMLCVRQSYWFL